MKYRIKHVEGEGYYPQCKTRFLGDFLRISVDLNFRTHDIDPMDDLNAAKERILRHKAKIKREQTGKVTYIKVD